MDANVNFNVLKNFLTNDLGIRQLNQEQAEDYDIDADKFAEVAQDENVVEVNDILEDDDLYEQFATLYVEKKELKTDEKNKDQEKEEQTKIDEKNGAGGA